MNARTLCLALSAFAVLSTTAANAQAAYFGYGLGPSYGYGLGPTNVLSYPAVVGGSALVGAPAIGGCGPAGCDVPLFGKRTWFDNRFGYGMGLRRGCYSACGVNSLAAVIPSETCGAAPATPICGQRRANALFDVRLFGFGLGFGTVSPRWDNRPAGWSH